MKAFSYLRESLINGKINFFFFLLLVFTLPISRQLFTIAMWPWLFTWIIEGRYREKFNRANIKNNLLALSFLPGLFLLMLISLLWSTDKSNGFNQLGIQASMIIFPVFFGLSNKVYRQEGAFKKIIISFTAGILVISLYLLAKAIIYTISVKGGQFSFNPVINEWENVFFFSQFSFLIHPTYLGLMVLLAASFCIIDIKREICFKNGSVYKVLIIIFLYFIIFLISSRSIILASVIIGFWLIISLFTNRIIKYLAITLFSVAFIVFLNLNPRITHFIDNYKQTGGVSLENIDVRFRIWESSFLLITDNPLTGVGTGDVKNRLEDIYASKGYEFPTIFNSHNQYLEQWLSSGIAGLLVLLAGLFLPLFIKNKKLPAIYYSSFMIITGFVFLFESILCRFWGVAFFSIFYTLLTRRYEPGKEEESGDGWRIRTITYFLIASCIFLLNVIYRASM